MPDPERPASLIPAWPIVTATGIDLATGADWTAETPFPPLERVWVMQHRAPDVDAEAFTVESLHASRASAMRAAEKDAAEYEATGLRFAWVQQPCAESWYYQTPGEDDTHNVPCYLVEEWGVER